MQYTLILSYSPSGLISQVQDQLAEGWQISGGIAIDTNLGYWVQPMVKMDSSSKKTKAHPVKIGKNKQPIIKKTTTTKRGKSNVKR